MTFNDLNSIEGLQFMPIAIDKRPIFNNWQNMKTKYDFTNAVACGLVCGSISGNVEAIDFDLKYDLSGTLMDEYISYVNSISEGLISRLVVQRTKSGGYHIIYRCSEIDGNLKLANRPSTQQEKEDAYNRSLHNNMVKLGATNNPNDPKFQEACSIAKKAMDHDKVRVLIETRGEKGQIACYPTPGYEMIQGSWDKIPEITPDERQILFDVAYSFNQYFSKPADKPSDHGEKKRIKGKTPSEDFNERGDVVGLLQRHGWVFVKKIGDKYLMRRPGDTTAKTSGNYDEDKKWFSVFSTSTEFEPQKPYKPYAVYAMLECGGDYSKVTKKLADEGYGDPLEVTRENRQEVPSIVDTVDDDDFSFLATDEDTDEYLKSWKEGSFELGKTTGIPKLDDHFRFKKGNFVMTNGIDNVGKSLFLWYLIFLSCYFHGNKAVIFSSENKLGHIKRKVMEFFWSKKLNEMTPEEYDEANRFFKSHFRLIKNNETTLYNYMDIINMVKKIKSKGDFVPTDILIDPYNSLKVESKQSYEYHYQALSHLKLFGSSEEISIYLNAHVGTAAARKKDKENFTLAPGKEDTEMGVMGANKADDFLTIHRLSDHETDFIYTELHVRKIKDTETGGKPTSKNKPILFRPVNGLVGFIQIDERSVSAAGINPVLNKRAGSNIIQEIGFPPIIDGGQKAPW